LKKIRQKRFVLLSRKQRPERRAALNASNQPERKLTFLLTFVILQRQQAQLLKLKQLKNSEQKMEVSSNIRKVTVWHIK